ncbi:MAG: amidotransferase [Saprospiraceae bacterium]
MTVGLLVCDQVRPEYKEAFGTYPGMFQALFPEYEFKSYRVHQGEFPESVMECEVYMATGSSHSVYENLEWIHQTKAFIRALYEANRYFIGFCFGHQLMASALGGKVEKAAIGWCVGVHEFEVVHLKYWMRPAKTQVNFLMMCQDQVVELPPNTIRLAGSKACPNAMLQIGERMISVQGHPEFSTAYDQTLMESRVEKIGATTVASGIASLDKRIDVDLFRTWVARFLNA